MADEMRLATSGQVYISVKDFKNFYGLEPTGFCPLIPENHLKKPKIEKGEIKCPKITFQG